MRSLDAQGTAKTSDAAIKTEKPSVLDVLSVSPK